MPFPPSNREIYTRNPLETVICQLKFPPILRIDAELPATFQERIRGQFPQYRETSAIEFVAEIPEPLRQFFRGEMAPHRRSFNFASADDVWSCVLTRDSIALETRRYQRWEEFHDRLELPLGALRDIYQPAFYSRVGLRYQNVIKRSRLGLEQVPWHELLRAEIAAELGAPDIRDIVLHTAREAVLAIEKGFVRVQHGLSQQDESSEAVYVIDADFFREERTEISHATGILNSFHETARCLFRWYISDSLHNAMEPTAA